MNLGESTWNGSQFPSREKGPFAPLWFNIRQLYANVSYLKHLVIYNNGALTGSAGSSIIGIDYSTGSIYYKNSSGNWALASSGGSSLTLTTTGSSGPATLIGTTLNIPNYVTPQGNLTGDVTSVGLATTLAIVNSNVGTFGASAGTTPQFTVNAKGLITAASANSIQISESQVTNLTTDLAGKQATLVSGTNIKTINGNSVLGSGNLTISGGSTALATNKIGVGNGSGVLDAIGTNSPTFNQSTLDLSNVNTITTLQKITYGNLGTGSTYATVGGLTEGLFADTYDANYSNPDGSHDQVRRWGYNLNGGGGILDSTKDTFGAGLAQESKYNGTIGPYQSEFHYQVVTTSGLQERLFSYLTDRNSGYTYKYNLLDQEDWFTTVTGPSGTPYMSIFPSAGYFKLAMPSMGFSLQETVGSNAFSISPQSDGSVNIANNSLSTTPGPMGIYTGSGDFSFKGLVSGVPATLYHLIPNGTGAQSFLTTPGLNIYSSGVDFGNVEFSLNTSGAIYQVQQLNSSSGITQVNCNGNITQYSPPAAGNYAQIFTPAGSSAPAFAIKNGSNNFLVQTNQDIYGSLQSNSTTQSQLGLLYGAGSGKQAFFNVNSDGSLTIITQPVNKIMLGGGYPFIIPTAQVQLPVGVSTAAGAPLKFTQSGAVLQTTPEAGAVEVDNNNIYYTNSASTRLQLASILSATATLAFPSTAAGAKSDLTITVTGAVSGDCVSVGIPTGSVPANGSFFGWVSASNTVTIRYTNDDLLTAYQPASGTFKASIIR